MKIYKIKFEKKDHERLAKLLKKSKFSFLVTYDNTQFIRELYDWAYQKDYTWKYTVQQTHNKARNMGEELFITNFEFKDKIQKKLI